MDLDEALGIWLPKLRIVLFNIAHPALDDGLNDQSFAEMVADVAWHEWGHALSIDRSTKDDIRAWGKYLAMAPAGIAERIRRAGYRRGEITHEIIASTYAALISRRVSGAEGIPEWLDQETHELMKRVTEWPG
ncbi:MAG: hypothetical protein WAP35_05895 [Solirubrobacterales bacterium]